VTAVSVRRSETLVKIASRAANLGFWEWELASGRVEFSDECKQQLGYARDALTDPALAWERFVHPDDLPGVQQRIAEWIVAPSGQLEWEFRLQRRDGTWRWFRAHADVLNDEQGVATHVLVAQLDLSEFKQREYELRRANRMLRLISESNQALIRVTDEPRLLDQVCQIAVDIGGYRGAWVGLLESGRVLRPVAWAGAVGDPESLRVSCDEAAAEKSPIARAVATGSVCLARNRADDPWYSFFKDDGPAAGAASVIVMPLAAGGQRLGTVTIYAGREDDFTEGDVDVLQELAGDLAFGLHVLRTRVDRDRAIEALQVSEQRLAEAERIAQLGYWEWDVATDVALWSAEAHRIFGRSEHAGVFDREAFKALVHPDDRERVSQVLSITASGGPTPDLEYRIVRPDGAVRCVLSRVASRQADPGGRQVLFGTIQDITERKQAEHALRAHMERVVQQEAALIALTRTDPEHEADLRTSLRRLTEASARALGVARVSVWRYATDRQAIHCADLYELAADRHSEGLELEAVDYPAYFAALARNDLLVASEAEADPQTAELADEYLRPLGITSLMDVPIRLKDGLEGVLCHEHSGPRREWTSDERTFALAISNLITLALEDVSRRQAQAALHTREQEYRALVENSPDVICRYDREGRILYVNPSCERLLGRTLADLVGTHAMDRFPPNEGLTNYRRLVDDVVRTGRAAECELGLDFLGGYLATHYVRLVPERDSVGRIVSVLAIGRDITPLKETEQRLRESELRFRQVTENIDEVFWLTDLERERVIYVSPAYERVWGRTCESLYEDRRAWFEAAHPDDRSRVEEAVMSLRETGGYDLEYRVIRPDGSMRWVQDRAFPIRDASGTVTRVAGVAEDITTRRQLEEQFRQSQKMEAIGRLAGGVAHDFNNLLAVIQMQSELLLETTQEPATREGVAQIMASTKRASNLTRQLLTFSRREFRQPKAINLADVVGGTSDMLRRLLGEEIVLESRFAPRLPLVHADAGMMEQVVLNLAVNARDAMPEGGRLTISLDAVVVGPERVAGYSGVSPGSFVCLSVSDTGTGIPPESLPRIFEPFFTTKDVGKGTGLGLATVFGIAQQHRGWVEAESELGLGSTFRLYVPALDGSLPQTNVTPMAETPRGRNETVLLAEDERSVRMLTRTLLERHGYRVLEAGSAGDAIAVWEKVGGKVDLLFTDLVMPGGASGWELSRQLLERDPKLKVIYSSGYSADVVERRLPSDAGKHFLRKPYAVQEMIALVRRVLDEK
jgi:two-component system, cell cycle sensor histidine kinase and response regulator CckA